MIQSIRQRCLAARTLGWTGRLGLALNPYYVYVNATERSLFTSLQLKGMTAILTWRATRSSNISAFRTTNCP